MPEQKIAKHLPRRTCVVCRDERPKRDLLRLVYAVDGMVEVDESGKMPGRGAYLCQSLDCWKKGLTRGRLERALRRKIDPESRDRLMRFAIEYCGESGNSLCQVGDAE